MGDRYHLGRWQVDLDQGRLERRFGLRRRRVELAAGLPELLRALLESGDQALSREVLASRAWPRRVTTVDAVDTALFELAAILRDGERLPPCIARDEAGNWRLVARHRRRDPHRGSGTAAAVTVVSMLLAVGTALTVSVQNGPAREPLLYVESVRDQSGGALLPSVSDSIDSTLQHELLAQLPGKVHTGVEALGPRVTLRTQIVACDAGPQLWVTLVDDSRDRYFWTRAYALDPTTEHGNAPDLAGAVADDVRNAFIRL